MRIIMSSKTFQHSFYKFAVVLLSSCLLFGCKKFIGIDAPINTTNEEIVYGSDETAIAVLTGIYTNLSIDDKDRLPNFGNGLALMNLYPSLSADELTLYSGVTNQQLINYYKNQLTAGTISLSDFWIKIYKQLFVVNSAIQGISNSKSLNPKVQRQLLGEAYFLRAFCFFYLVNLYGDVPLILSTDYSLTSLQAKNNKDEVYSQILADLKDAQNFLSDEYFDGKLTNTTSDRIRPNKSTATALLARVYLYNEKWLEAEMQASLILDNTSLYDTTSLSTLFLKNSKETIWALQPVGSSTSQNTGSGKLFIIPSSGPTGSRNPVYLSSQLVDSFQSGDQRLVQWTNTVTVSGTTYRYPFKYKVGSVNTPTVEYPIILRVGEQYLIRAEARIRQGKIEEGIADINILRLRATDVNAAPELQLLQLPAGLSQEQALAAVLHERQIELFTEWGHRWLDLKRTKTIDEVMNTVAPLKGSSWDSHSALYPIPSHEIQTNPNLVQNPGYPN